MILVEDRGRVRLLTLNRPEALNAFDSALYRATGAALDDARADDNVHAVVLTGAGRAFSAGQDLKEMARLAAGEPGLESGFPVLLEALQTFDKPLIAAVNGVAVGIGMTLLPHCDIVLVANDARFRTPFAEMGVAPEAGSSYLFPARMGAQRAAFVLLTGEWLNAEQAVEYGLAFSRHIPVDLLPRAVAVATEIAASTLPALRAIKLTMRAGELPAIVAARAREEAEFARLLATFTNPG
ncbi:MAG: enoyl-CoA hydratase-related protein [Actinomycetota bacterium]|nr:enoyl-CoA hydratase-related protein [Actinomycetota bacterium]